MFNSYVRQITRGLNSIKSHETNIFLWFSYGFPMVIPFLHHLGVEDALVASVEVDETSLLTKAEMEEKDPGKKR